MLHENRSNKLGILFILFVLLIGTPIARLLYFALTPVNSNSQEEKIIEVHKGESPNEITKNLITSGVISNGKELIWLGRLTRQWKRIKAGEYQVSAAMTPLEILSIVTSGISVSHPVTVREGENIYEISDDLAAKGLAEKTHFLALCHDKDFIRSLGKFKDHPPFSLEGYFFPDTYFFNRSMTEMDMAREMAKHFFDHWSQKDEERAQEWHMTRHQMITLASMIEKETGAPEERALISSVFHNRLRKRMKLQSDPTTIYGMWERFKGKIHKSDLSAKNEYNTYVVDALPIGPIGNPGEASIHAALYPVESPYYYFVSHNDGTHQFSATFEEHNRAVQKYQLDPRARAGKSWRDHLKKPASVQQNN